MTKRRTKEQEAEYRRAYRARKNVLPDVLPECPTPVPPTEIVPPCPTVNVLPCPTCQEKDMKILILKGQVTRLEKEVVELRKQIPEKVKSPYRGF
jgi:hypothetical protein